MGILDLFRRSPDVLPEHLVRMGKLEGQVESLQFQWATARDEMLKLVQRLEKREQRAAQREQKESVAPPVEPLGDLELEGYRALQARRRR